MKAFYIDGASMDFDNGDSWKINKVFNIPGDAKCIAVSAWNTNQAAGIMACATDYSIVTDLPTCWKCKSDLTDDEKANWMNVDFDDSEWDCCYVSDQNVKGLGRMQYDKDMCSAAYWIWCNLGKGVQPYDGWNEKCFARLSLAQ